MINESEFLKLKDTLESYDDGVITIVVDQEANDYILLKLKGHSLDNYNYELFLSVIVKILNAGIRKIAIDLRDTIIFTRTVCLFSRLCQILNANNGNLLISRPSEQMYDFTELVGPSGEYRFSIDIYDDMKKNIPFYKGNKKLTTADPEPLLQEAIGLWTAEYDNILETTLSPYGIPHSVYSSCFKITPLENLFNETNTFRKLMKENNPPYYVSFMYKEDKAFFYKTYNKDFEKQNSIYNDNEDLLFIIPNRESFIFLLDNKLIEIFDDNII